MCPNCNADWTYLSSNIILKPNEEALIKNYYKRKAGNEDWGMKVYPEKLDRKILDNIPTEKKVANPMNN